MIDVDLAKAIKDVKEYEWCNHDENYLLNNNKCGCGKYHLHQVGSDNIHWLGLHWEIECAFRYAIAGLSQSFYIFKLTDEYITDEA